MEQQWKAGLSFDDLDWSVRDVMVGVLHDRDQLEANLQHLFYHMPAALLTDKPEKIRYVALYQSRNLFGDVLSGVRVYGRVSGFSLVPRGDITEIPSRRNSQELYYRFDVESWQKLEPHIKAGSLAPGVSMFTTLFLLRHSRYFPELYLRTAGELELYTILRRASARTLRNGGSELLPGEGRNTVMVAGRDIGVYTPDGRYIQYDLHDFFHRPHSFLQKVAAALEFDIT